MAVIVLAVPALTVFAFAPAGAAETVALAPGDDPVVTGLGMFKQSSAQPAPVQARKAGEAPAEVLAQEWVATGGGSGGGGSPKK